ncbi:hypothetical protein MNBD_GAMMA01-429 [hydrothermal vent metagenome]|uniref:DUF3379 domain-containing protein n=1 Tax=hydrothermal vent metagenome TaxID=652676 RepID=A0A3B0V6Z9_9ZZZZ
MNYFEFKQQLLKDLFTTDAEFQRLRKQDPRCAKAYDEAMEFEKNLKMAFAIKAPDNFKDSIILRQTTQNAISRSIRQYAIAATIFLSMVIIATTWYMQKSGPIEQFVIEALVMEPEVYMSDQALPRQQLDELFASLNTKIDGELGQVHFMKICKAPGGTGARMVLMTDTGPVTILYMPDADLDKRIDFELKKYKGSVIAMEKGAAAIIGGSDQQLAYIEDKIQTTLVSMQ